MAVEIDWLDSVDSTNEEAKRRAASGEPGPLWIAARVQTSGRGRRGRAWDSEAGNLFCTLLLRPDCEAARAAQLAFAAGLAVADSCAHWAPAEDISQKWPNDVLAAGRKVSGCLLETGIDSLGRWLAVGVGVNLVSSPSDTIFPATHLAAHLKAGAAPPAPEAFLERLSAAFPLWLSRWEREGFAPLREAFLARAAGLGEPITARLADGSALAGVFEDIDASGALILRGAHNSVRAVAAGDIFFPAGAKG